MECHESEGHDACILKLWVRKPIVVYKESRGDGVSIILK